MNLTVDQIKTIGRKYGLTFAELRAFISVESGGEGFIKGRIVIQFEPAWYRKKAPFAPSGLWSINKVENQTKEYIAFSDAFRKNANAAMEATSWGLGQIMGFHYKRLGYSSVGAMVDHFKESEYAQVEGIAKFITTDARLFKAIKSHDWHMVAVLYNGAGYKDLAKKYGREPYNISLEKAYIKWAKVEVVKAPANIAGSKKMTVTHNLNMRKGPGADQAWMLTIPAGKSVTEITRENGWSQVIYGDKTGFVATQYLTAV